MIITKDSTIDKVDGLTIGHLKLILQQCGDKTGSFRSKVSIPDTMTRVKNPIGSGSRTLVVAAGDNSDGVCVLRMITAE